MFGRKVGGRKPQHGATAGEVLGIVALVGVIGAGVAAWAIWIRPAIDRHQMLNQRGTPRGSLIVGDHVVVLDQVSVEHRDRDDSRRDEVIERTRVTVLAAATGQQVSQELVNGFGGCAVAGERVWCDLGELALYDVKPWKRVATFEALVAKAKLGKLVDKRWRVLGTRAVQMLSDGRVAVVDGAAAAPEARREDTVPRELADQTPVGVAPAPGSLTIAQDCGAREAAAQAMFATKKDKGRRVESGGPRVHVVQDGVASAETYLQPAWLAGELPLLVHHTSMTRDDDRTQLSRLDPAGKATWTAELGVGCETYAIVGKLAVVTTADPHRRVVAVDVDAGTVKYVADL